MGSPVDEQFWSYLSSLDCLLVNEDSTKLPTTLLEWKHLISALKYSKSDYLKFSQSKNPLVSLFKQRYGLEDSSLVQERLHSLEKTLDDCIRTQNFDLNAKISLVFSNGRDRYFGGHTDLLGLGGPTINATTESEIVSVGQKSPELDSKVFVTNSNPEYKSCSIDLKEIEKEIQRFESEKKKLGDQIWDPNEWTSYLKGLLGFMFSSRFSARDKVKRAFGSSGLRVHFSSIGKRKLLSRVGSSSSSALTSAFVLELNALFDLGTVKSFSE
jgi:hypothetical protein